MAEKAPARNSSAGSRMDRDVERQSIDSESDIDSLEIADIEAGRREKTMTEKGDIEAYPDGVNQPQNEMWITESAPEKDSRGLAGVLSRMSTKSSWKDPGPPPDGGTKAWMQVAYGHLVIMATWGFINSFGVFQTYYVTALNRAPGDISWIGSVQIFLLFFVGTFSGRLTDAGLFRPVFLVGSFFAVFGLFMASLSTTYVQLFLSQGVCVGLGNGMLFCPAISLLSTYFSKKRSLAIGISAAGSATGGMIFPVMVQQLIPKIGFAWTMRSLAFIELAILVVCNIGIKPRVPPRKTGDLVDWKSFKEVPYVLFAAAMFFNFWGVYFAFFFLGSFARETIGLPMAESINLLIVLNGVGILGRIVPNHIADRYIGPLNTLIPMVLFTSILAFAWIAIDTRGGLYGWAVVYGMVGAAIQSLFPATLSSLTTDLRMAGTRMGMVFSIVSFAVLTGPPISGQLIELKNGEFQYAQMFSGACMFVGTVLLIGARLAKNRGLKVKL